MAALRAAVFPVFAKNRRGGHFLPPPPPVRVLRAAKFSTKSESKNCTSSAYVTCLPNGKCAARSLVKIKNNFGPNNDP